MGKNITTAEVIQLMLEECPKGSKQVADECGINYSTFMRKVSPVDNATSFNVEELIKYMAATDNDMIIDHLNERRGRMYVPFPRGIRKGTDPKQDINAFGSKAMKMCSKLLHYVAEGGSDLKEEILEMLRIHQGDTENMRRRVRDNKLHQRELF